jgi:hypothetical protein
MRERDHEYSDENKLFLLACTCSTPAHYLQYSHFLVSTRFVFSFAMLSLFASFVFLFDLSIEGTHFKVSTQLQAMHRLDFDALEAEGNPR